MMNSLSLEPSTSVSEFVRYYSNTVQVWIIVIDLTVRVSPSISNSDALKNNASLL